MLFTLGNLIILLYIGQVRSLVGAAYAQADLGLFFLLLEVGPIALACLGLLVIGHLRSWWSCRWSCASNAGFNNLLKLGMQANIIVVSLAVAYLFFWM
jgi:hypothetical protein